MIRTLVMVWVVSSVLVIAACNAANQGTTRPGGRIPGQAEPGSPAAQMQQ